MSDDSSSRIAAALRAWLSTAPPGAKLPTSRALVTQYAASPVTVHKALRSLVSQGLVETVPGVGAFARAIRTPVASDYGWQTAALGSPGHQLPRLPSALQTAPGHAVALHSGYPDPDLLPGALLRSAFARAARSSVVVSRAPAAGMPELQAWFAAELAAATPAGIPAVTARDAVLIPGSQSGLVTAFRALVGPDRPLLLESPTYWGAILAAAKAGVETVPVPSGPDGPDPEVLSRTFERTGARAFYAQPSFHSPTGALWRPELADRILETVRRNGAFLIEDDAAHDFGITAEPRPLAAQDAGGHVVYVRSLTKSVSPALRVAALIARGPVRDRLLADTQAESMYVSPFLQAVALDVVTQPAWRTYLRRLRQHLRNRRDLLLTSLAEHTPSAHVESVPAGGLNLWARLPDTTDLAQVVRGCEAAGVLIGPGDDWFPAEPTGRFVRLTYAGPNPEAFPDAARLLEDAIRQSS